MSGDSILNYVFDYDMCQSIENFTQVISSSSADVYIVMSRKAACFISFLKRHGKISFNGKLVTDRILDFGTEWLRDKSVIVVDDVIVSGTTIFSVIQKLNKVGVCSIKVYVLGVNECFFNPDILEYTDANQQVISYLEPPYIPLTDAACMRTCSNIVSTFALDIMPYDVDFPKHEYFSISSNAFNQLVASSNWYSYDVSSDLQAENNIKNVTMLPSDRIKALFDQETGMPVSKLGFFKIRLFARPNEKKGKYLVNAIPYFLFNAITAVDILAIFDNWFADVPTKPESNVAKIRISQLKFLYPLKTLVFPAFSPPRFGPFPSFFPLREEMRETFFRPSLQPYPAALRKFAWPLWWRGRKCSSWYLHQNVPAAPAHPWVPPRGREGWSYMYASTDGSENHPYPRSSFGSIGIRC